MGDQEAAVYRFNWRIELPVLSGRLVTLREPTPVDCDSLLTLLSEPDATRFGLDGSPGPASIHRMIDRLRRANDTLPAEPRRYRSQCHCAPRVADSTP